MTQTKKKTEAEILIEIHLQELGLVPFVAEHPFHPQRDWRFDRAVLRKKLAFEIEGGIWVPGGGGHNRGRDFQDDLDKYNAAAALGWIVFRFSVDDVRFGKDIAPIRAFLERKRARN